jgi:hypothetical protein
LKLIANAPRGGLVTVVVLALGGLIAACGSASSGSSSASATSSTSTTASAASGGTRPNSSQRTALAACLKQHGVTLPSRPAGAPPGGAPPGSGSGTGTTGTGTTGTGTTPRRGFFGGGGGFANNPKLRAALQACGAKFGFRGGGQGFRGRLSRTAVTKYVTCVRQHGYNLPSPNFSGKGPIFPANIRTNKKFQAASRSCQNLLAPPRPSGSGGGTSTNSGA